MVLRPTAVVRRARTLLISATACSAAAVGGYVAAGSPLNAAQAASPPEIAHTSTAPAQAVADADHHRSRRKVISTDDAPKAIGPYSQAVVAKGTLYASGMLPIDPRTNTLLGSGTIEEQTKLVLSNLDAVLAEAHLTKRHVVSTTVYLSDLRDFDRFNAVYAAHFGTEGAPARATVQVARIPRDAKVEIGLIAVR